MEGRWADILLKTKRAHTGRRAMVRRLLNVVGSDSTALCYICNGGSEAISSRKILKRTVSSYEKMKASNTDVRALINFPTVSNCERENKGGGVCVVSGGRAACERPRR